MHNQLESVNLIFIFSEFSQNCKSLIRKNEDRLMDKEQEPFSVRNEPVFEINISRKLLEGNFAEEVTCEMDELTFQSMKKT